MNVCYCVEKRNWEIKAQSIDLKDVHTSGSLQGVHKRGRESMGDSKEEEGRVIVIQEKCKRNQENSISRTTEENNSRVSKWSIVTNEAKMSKRKN